MNYKIAALLFMFSLIFLSGCVQPNPNEIARASPIIKEFLADYPNAEVRITHFSKADAEKVIDTIRIECQKPALEAKDFYKVSFEDTQSGLSAYAWIDNDKGQVECAYKKGQNEPVEPAAQTDCDSNSDCLVANLRQNLPNCTPKIFLFGDSKNEFQMKYEIKGRTGDICNFYQELLKAPAEQQQYVGVNMTCKIPTSSLNEPEVEKLAYDPNYCSGTLYDLFYKTVQPQIDVNAAFPEHIFCNSSSNCDELSNALKANLPSCTPKYYLVTFGSSDGNSLLMAYQIKGLTNGYCGFYQKLVTAPEDKKQYEGAEMTCSIPASSLSGPEVEKLVYDPNYCSGALYDLFYKTTPLPPIIPRPNPNIIDCNSDGNCLTMSIRSNLSACTEKTILSDNNTREGYLQMKYRVLGASDNICRFYQEILGGSTGQWSQYLGARMDCNIPTSELNEPETEKLLSNPSYCQGTVYDLFYKTIQPPPPADQNRSIALPDLVVTNLAYYRRNLGFDSNPPTSLDAIVFSATIKNDGNTGAFSPSDRFTIKITLEPTSEYPSGFTYSVTTVNMGAGAEELVYFNDSDLNNLNDSYLIKSDKPLEANATVFVDAGNDVNESGENNNILTKHLSIPTVETDSNINSDKNLTFSFTLDDFPEKFVIDQNYVFSITAAESDGNLASPQKGFSVKFLKSSASEPGVVYDWGGSYSNGHWVSATFKPTEVRFYWIGINLSCLNPTAPCASKYGYLSHIYWHKYVYSDFN